MSTNDFYPDWVSPPGDTIVDILRESDLSLVEFAQRIGYEPELAKDLIQGRATITIAIARQLVKVLGASVEFWMSRDYQYRQDISRLHVPHAEWLDRLPLGDMIKFGWLNPVPHPADEVAACLRFFNLPSIQAWNEAYASLLQMTAFRTSSSFDSQPAAVAAWLRQGEIEAETIDCSPWDAKRFQESLVHIRSLTRIKNPSLFLPELKKCCADSGVAVAIVRAPSGCRASGATRFLSGDKALLLLSFRYLTDDHFWFTFFHEAGHLLLHGEAAFFLEGVDMLLTPQEEEANEFASRTLIPVERQPEFLRLRANAREVIRFAVRIGVAPGIVVGQLQHLGKLRYDQLNRLKRRFTWKD
jgi:HTH-type transcriptional regulator/antitoxin HigA